MIVELFYAPGCEKCAASQAKLKAAALETIEGLTWREVNVLAELDYAVELGVLTPPAVAIDRELVFASLPTPEQLRGALLRQMRSEG